MRCRFASCIVVDQSQATSLDTRYCRRSIGWERSLRFGKLNDFGRSSSSRANTRFSLGHWIRSVVTRVRAGAEVATSPRLAFVLALNHGKVN
jgi:hypothetical protein